jgi:dTDP-4-amino-4,6-dideoxygalactose transaminase
VITTPFTLIATTEAIRIVGATPVFVDIDPRTFNIDPMQIEPAITPRTKALLPVHLYGQPCDMHALLRIANNYGLAIVEDCAQAIGATYAGRKVGSFGSAGCLSFFPSKNLGCFGDGGMVVTDDQRLYARVEMLRRHGGKVKYYHTELGLNSRLDELQAAILRVAFRRLDAWNDVRREHAYQYNNLLANDNRLVCPSELAASSGETIVPGADLAMNPLLRAVYQQYTIQIPDRDHVARAMNDAGVGSAVYYPVPLHRQQVHEQLGYSPGAFPNAEHAANHCLSLPMFPYMSGQQRQRVIEVLRAALPPGVSSRGAESVRKVVAA